jgi:hypothetical protein
VIRPVTIVQRILLAIIALLAIVYAGDYLWLRVRMMRPNHDSALGTVQMYRLYAIPLNSGKTEYEFDAQQPEVTQPCVHSLFPHLGYSTCWYLKQKSQKPIPM